MEKVKAALEYAICVFDTLHNTQTYQGDNQDFSDEIITMRAALAELEQSTAVEPALLNTCLANAKQEPAQAVPVAIIEQIRALKPKTGMLRVVDLAIHDVLDRVLRILEAGNGD